MGKLLAVLVLIGLCCTVYGSTLLPEDILYQHVMNGYVKEMRPAASHQQAVNVAVQFMLGRLESLEEKDQVLTSFGWMIISWVDNRLSWDPAAFYGITKLVVPANDVWLPEISMLNSVDQAEDLSFDSDFRVAIYPQGVIQWIPSFKWKSSCSVSLQHFPFDKQICQVKFINWVYSGTKVDLVVPSEDVIRDKYEENGEWELTNSFQAREELIVEDLPDGVYPIVYFELTLTRKPQFFILNVLVPCIILSFISVLVFMLPCESGEKVSLSITVLLGFSVVLLMVSDITPRSGAELPYLTFFITLNMASTGSALLATVLVLNAYHHDPSRSVPNWLRVLVLRYLAKINCYGSLEGGRANSRVSPTRQGEETGAGAGEMVMEDVEDAKLQAQKAADAGAVMTLPSELVEYLESLAVKEREEACQEANLEEWKLVAQIIDRTCLWVFLAATVIVTALLLTITQLHA